MVSLRPETAVCLLAWLFFACAPKAESDDDASSREASGGTMATAGSGVSAAAGTNNQIRETSAGGAASAAGASTSGVADAGAAGAAAGPAAEFEQACLAQAASPCEQCLCSSCTEQLQACAVTDGCPALVVCIRDNHCEGIDCYCGSFDAVACVNGEADGPCKAAILDAPGGRVPTLLSPSAGPASDAAVAISRCEQSGQPCAEACSSR